MKYYWRIDPSQRWRQAPDRSTALLEASRWLRRQVGSEGFAPQNPADPLLRANTIEGEVVRRTPAIEIISEDEYVARGFQAYTTNNQRI
jgi:hypothetical protein